MPNAIAREAIRVRGEGIRGQVFLFASRPRRAASAA